MAAAEGEEVGALPHVAGVDGIGFRAWILPAAAFGEWVEVLPLGEVGGAGGKGAGAIEEGESALALDAGAYDEVLDLGLAGARGVHEGGGIAEAGDLEARRGCGDDGVRVGGPGAEVGVGGGSEELGFAEVVGAVGERGFGVWDGFDTGVEDGGGVVMEDGAAGEAAGGVWGRSAIGAGGRGGEGYGEATPVNEVGRGGVGPVHVAPDGGVGVVLVEHVVLAAEEDGRAGIVHPVAFGEVVEAGA